MYVYDNYFLSFSQVEMGAYPHIVLTYPKSARFLVDGEPNFLLANASQIRAYVVSPHMVTRVSASVDRVPVCPLMTQVNDTGLFKCAWDSAPYRAGFHTLTVCRSRRPLSPNHCAPDHSRGCRGPHAHHHGADIS